MRVRTFDMAGLLEFIPAKIGDGRGYFTEIWREDRFCREVGLVGFMQENQSLSARAGTIRGLHVQTHPAAQGKLVRCIAGAIMDVAVDMRRNSRTYGQWCAVELSAECLNQFWIPVGFAHGFCTLVPDTVVTYKVTNYYSPDNDKGVLWDDPAIGIEWPAIADEATLSPKDRVQPTLAQSEILF
ncbi:dTDP-4-dehydrorhamnose 3,5-epimerase [Novosphingobium sp. SG751A]|uniref:dTDP-4-dehydrorhamnose 3,5-epimerase n=1 Tax=Novosphingobium sp. SG751A TaxID=2587000 RepID=UPI001553D33B|nr:dTDP-4-dehydrorhamnose 3,5-epimerase [Novosphingobium sp. SG751A]NOW46437.1 dTDP-4-dehydrorhamnose 3,5-epimerase [Novosphingobium sp. SG751A]